MNPTGTYNVTRTFADAVRFRFLASDAASFVTGQTGAPTGPPHTFTPPEM